MSAGSPVYVVGLLDITSSWVVYALEIYDDELKNPLWIGVTNRIH
jgi:hypothetical protein